MTIQDALSTADTDSMLDRWNQECAKDPHISGSPYRLDPDLLGALISEIEIEPEDPYNPLPSVITAVIRFTESAGSAGVALRFLAALSRSSTTDWIKEEPSVAQDLLTRTQDVINAWMVMVGSRALNDLDRAAHFDDMTGLFNVRAFRRDLAAALDAPLRPVLVVYADIDGLKHVNDTHGHPAGDAMIRNFAQALNAACSRPGWKAYRWGGDEHALLLPGATSDEAALVMQRTRAAFDRFSWGLAVAPDDGDSVTELMNLSDDRMYAAKEARRKALWDSSRPLKYVARAERRFTAWRKELEERARRRSSPDP